MRRAWYILFVHAQFLRNCVILICKPAKTFNFEVINLHLIATVLDPASYHLLLLAKDPSSNGSKILLNLNNKFYFAHTAVEGGKWRREIFGISPGSQFWWSCERHIGDPAHAQTVYTRLYFFQGPWWMRQYTSMIQPTVACFHTVCTWTHITSNTLLPTYMYI